MLWPCLCCCCRCRWCCCRWSCWDMKAVPESAYFRCDGVNFHCVFFFISHFMYLKESLLCSLWREKFFRALKIYFVSRIFSKRYIMVHNKIQCQQNTKKIQICMAILFWIVFNFWIARHTRQWRLNGKKRPQHTYRVISTDSENQKLNRSNVQFLHVYPKIYVVYLSNAFI